MPKNEFTQVGKVQLGPRTTPDDPAYHLLTDDYTSTPKVTPRDTCYICMDPEFAQMGLPLCNKCPKCVKEGKEGHIAADDTVCDDCGYDAMDGEEEEMTDA